MIESGRKLRRRPAVVLRGAHHDDCVDRAGLITASGRVHLVEGDGVVRDRQQHDSDAADEKTTWPTAPSERSGCHRPVSGRPPQRPSVPLGGVSANSGSRSLTPMQTMVNRRSDFLPPKDFHCLEQRRTHGSSGDGNSDGCLSLALLQTVLLANSLERGPSAAAASHSASCR